MLRQSFNSAAGRSRPDLNRVADGIASTLRAFSTAQQLAVTPKDGNNNRDGGNSSQAADRRQRTTAAFNELLKIADTAPSYEQRGSPVNSNPNSNSLGMAFRKFNFETGSDSGFDNSIHSGGGGGGSRGRDVTRTIDLRPAMSGTGNAFDRRAPIRLDSAGRGGGNNIIRGGFRGGFRGRGGGGTALGRGGGRGRGGFGGRGGEARRGRGGRRRRGEDREGLIEEPDMDEEIKEHPAVQAWQHDTECGVELPYEPSLSKSDLQGYGPGVVYSGSDFAHSEVVLKQARILGSGQAFDPKNTLHRDDVRERFENGPGVFMFSEEGKKWTAEVLGVKEFPPVPKETKDAVLQAALLGQYEGRKFADSTDTLGTVANYVRRHSSWTPDAQRRIVEKISSLLPGGKTGSANAAKAGATG